MKRLRILLLPLFALLSAACDSPRKAPAELTLLSYNVGSFSKYETSSVTGVADIIRSSGATLAGLNELDSCNRRHSTYQLKELSRELGDWEFQFASAFPYAGGAYGNGIVSSVPLLGRYAVPLPKADGSEARSAAVVETAACVFATVHLDHKSENAQLQQIQVLNDWFSDTYPSSEKPVFLCGDFNALPDSEAIRMLQKDWALLSGTSFTYSTEHPGKCIDYIFVRKGGKAVEVLSSEVLTEGTASLSDHFPVVVKVRF